jgi:hypothetical protein
VGSLKKLPHLIKFPNPLVAANLAMHGNLLVTSLTAFEIIEKKG